MPKSAQKICQLTGERDMGHTPPIPTGNQSETRAKLVGTDLGSSFRGPFGTVFFLFGDSVPEDGVGRQPGADAVAYTADTNPENCVELTFVLQDDGGYKPPVLVENIPILPPWFAFPWFAFPWFADLEYPIPLGIFEVPTGGFFWNGTAYVNFQTQAGGDPFRPSRSVMASNTNLIYGGLTFKRLFDFDPDRFMNVASVLVDDSYEPTPAISSMSAERAPTKVLFFGTGLFRAATTLFLAQADLADIESGNLQYLNLDATGTPHWEAQSRLASELFPLPKPKCMGEISVTRNPYIGKWLAIYSCDSPRGINFRVADEPWGPWSEAAVLFEPRNDHGYCYFMHDKAFPDQPPPCLDEGPNPYDDLVDRKDDGGANAYGGEYAAYVIDAYTTGSMNDHTTTIYFTMSTWNPYQVVLMKSTLVRAGAMRQIQHRLSKWVDAVQRVVQR